MGEIWCGSTWGRNELGTTVVATENTITTLLRRRGQRSRYAPSLPCLPKEGRMSFPTGGVVVGCNGEEPEAHIIHTYIYPIRFQRRSQERKLEVLLRTKGTRGGAVSYTHLTLPTKA